MDWSAGIAVMGSLLGVLLGIRSQFSFEKLRAKKQRTELQNAMISEIRAILDLLDRDRVFVGILEDNLNRWRKEEFVSNPPFPKVLKGDLQADDIYATIMPVYRSNISNLGALNTESISRISQFYMRLMYVIYEWTLFSSKDFWGADHPRESKIKIVEKNLEAFKSTMSIAREIVALEY